ncbi:Intramolecular chaperone auto-processing domain containing protein [uncultured Caudovirales phage]|uniref:Intramolecular chaperone auto-processing domain containing protein n=1 Tax=uncultured Caudovirales phage TaxID=2100421 RepID=A0A6J5LJP5_9CAUD|nr:Intramolecular chaperone auto-processing domain containing protein [uncultured Caudovirales phage]
MSNIFKPAGGGAAVVQTIDGDSGSITGSVVTIFANRAIKNSGASVAFINSGTTSTFNLTDSHQSTYLGQGAGNLATPTTSGIQNTATGVDSLTSTTNNGVENCAYGVDSLNGLTDGDSNCAYGVGSGQVLTLGEYNCFFGYATGQAYTGSESNNIIIGPNISGTLGESGVIRIGDSNSFSPQTTCFIAGISGNTLISPDIVTIDLATGQLGNSPFPTSTISLTGDSGTITGSTFTIYSNNAANHSGSSVKFTNTGTISTLNLSDASSNTMLGLNAGNLTLSGSECTGIGATALHALTSGVFNTAVGSRSQHSMTTGNSNTSVGLASLGACVSGSENCAFGEECLTSNTASQNSAYGSKSMNAAGAGAENSCFGYASGNQITSGSNNVLVGYQSGNVITTGNFNTGFGNDSLAAVTTGQYNIGVGNNAGNALTGADSSNILINNTGVSGNSNEIRIGTQGSGGAQQNKCFIVGISGVTVAASVPVVIDANGQMGTVVSSARYKDNIENMDDSVSILGLKPVEFTYRIDVTKTKQYGLIAEEVAKEFPYLCVYDKEGQPDSVKYHELPVFLLKEIQRLNKRIEELEKKVA